MCLVDHDNRMLGIPGVSPPKTFEPAHALFDRESWRLGRWRAELLGQIREQVAAGHLWKYQMHPWAIGCVEFVTKPAHEHGLTDAGRPGQEHGPASVFHRVTQLQKRGLVRFARKKRATDSARLKRFGR